MKNKKLFILFVSIICLVAVALVIETNTHLFEKSYANIVLDSSQSYKSCDKWPAFIDAEKIVQENEGELNKLKEFDPGIYWWIDDQRCAGKGEFLIFYGSHNSRLEIEKIIKNNDFHGVPASLRNI